MKKKYVISTFMAASLLAGCATVFSGTSQTVSVRAIDADTQALIPGAVCRLSDGRGNVYPVMGNPGSVRVINDSGPLSVSCTKPGYRQAQVGVGKSFNLWTVGDVVFWPSLIVDAATGAVMKYPSYVTVLMQRGR